MIQRALALIPPAAVVAALLVGCSTATPQQRAVDRGVSTVDSAVQSATTWPDRADEIEVRGRYNPCRCPAPDFEVYAYGGWNRVILDGSREMLQELRAEAEALDETPGLVFFRLRGQFDGTAEFDSTGWDYDRFQVVGYGVESGDGAESEPGG